MGLVNMDITQARSGFGDLLSPEFDPTKITMAEDGKIDLEGKAIAEGGARSVLVLQRLVKGNDAEARGVA
jgi:hypothetical protein